MSNTRRSSRVPAFLRAAAAVVVVALVALVALTGGTGPAGAIDGQYWISKLSLSKVWKITRGQGVTVAVVDTGVPPTPVLGDRLLTGTDTLDGSPSGRHDPGEAAAGMRVSHGQAMAQLIAGDGAGGGIDGIAPAAKILPIRALSGPDSGSDATIAAGVRYAVNHGASVINLSLGNTRACSSADTDALKYAYQHDDIVVVASGNDGGAVGAPANCPGAIAVAGIRANGSYYRDSSYGPQIDVANFATNIPSGTLDGGFVNGSGTSPATAFTSGEIALLRSAFPHDSARQIITRLLYGIDTLSSVPTGTFVNDHVGYGVPVPLSALKAKVPADAVNPIYDRFAQELGAGSGNASGSPSGSSSTPSGNNSGGASQPSVGRGPSTPASASGGGGGGISPILVVVIVVVVVVAAIVIAVAVSRSRRRRPPPGYGPPGGFGPPPPGFGPPPPGYGPPGRP